eukprot:5689580-Pyramimonas_sp.AAC.1
MLRASCACLRRLWTASQSAYSSGSSMPFILAASSSSFSLDSGTIVSVNSARALASCLWKFCTLKYFSSWLQARYSVMWVIRAARRFPRGRPGRRLLLSCSLVSLVAPRSAAPPTPPAPAVEPLLLAALEARRLAAAFLGFAPAPA